jgi:FlaA1/EpsC-like NDP-sugar epimerase
MGGGGVDNEDDRAPGEMTPRPGRHGRGWLALVEHRFAYLALWDAGSWAVALLLATWIRYEFDVSRIDLSGLVSAIPLVVAVQLVVGLWQGLYLGRWRLGSFEEIAALLVSVVSAAITLFVVDQPTRWVPISVPVAAPFIALVGMAALRYTWRLVVERGRRPSEASAARTIVFGAGEGAHQVITAMLLDPDSPYLPVALADDNPRKARLRVRGVPVRGTRDDLPRIAEEAGAEVLLIAIPSADGSLMRELAQLGDEAGLKVMAVPAVTDLFDDGIGVADIRPLTTADLLGRREIDTDIAGIAGYLHGRRVLVTGAGGSIGSELCRQVSRFGPAALVMLDRDESGLHAVQLSIEGRAMLDSRNLVVADIRDRERLADVFAEHRPEVVFHAAALKHLPLCEMHPFEAVKTNVWGTNNLLELSMQHDVTTFVNISTDKAADPVSVLGATKRIAERTTAEAARRASGTYLSVRFGNVLGSRGSVLGTFRAQIEQGGPITVTDPDATRFFMTVEEAVQLVVQAGAIGVSGEAMVLEMGEPVRIAEVARRLADEADRPIDIVYTGLRPGEKTHEVLQGSGEHARPSNHPLIVAVDVPPLDPMEVEGLSATSAGQLLLELDEHISSEREATPAPPREARPTEREATRTD